MLLSLACGLTPDLALRTLGAAGWVQPDVDGNESTVRKMSTCRWHHISSQGPRKLCPVSTGVNTATCSNASTHPIA